MCICWMILCQRLMLMSVNTSSLVSTPISSHILPAKYSNDTYMSRTDIHNIHPLITDNSRHSPHCPPCIEHMSRTVTLNIHPLVTDNSPHSPHLSTLSFLYRMHSRGSQRQDACFGHPSSTFTSHV